MSEPTSQPTDDLFGAVYAELHELAAARLAAEPSGISIQATALVHEAYLRLAKRNQEWTDRSQILIAAAQAMRRILVDRARRRGRVKRGGRRVRVELLDVADSLAEDPDLLLSLDELLGCLAEEDDTAARLTHLHLFGGLSITEAGEVLGLSRPVAYRNWKYARAWLREALE